MFEKKQTRIYKYLELVNQFVNGYFIDFDMLILKYLDGL